MIVKSTKHASPIGDVKAIEVAIARVFRRIQHDGLDRWVHGDGWSLELSLMPTKSGIVEVITVTPRGPQPEAIGTIAGPWQTHLEQLAHDLKCVVFDPQTGLLFGGPRAPAVPLATASYAFSFVHPMGPFGTARGLGSRADVWKKLGRAIRVTEDAPSIGGPGWSLRFALTDQVTERVVVSVNVNASWDGGAARTEALAVLHALSVRENWVPFDPQRNDTVDFHKIEQSPI